MNKDQAILAVGRLVFDLARLGNTGTDLDELQVRLFDLLKTLPNIRVIPKSVVLLCNPRQRLIQVAQFGLPAVWAAGGAGGALAEPDDGVEEPAYLATPASHVPPLQLDTTVMDAPCFVLPLRSDGRLLGRLLCFIEPGWQPTPFETEFMTDLARALSVLVSRCLLNEILRVREVELEDARTDVIRRLGTASEYRDNETGMHIMRMTHYATATAKALGLPPETRELLAICAPMHDVGKIGISDSILLKPGRLSQDEFEVMKTHTEIGKRLLLGEDTLISVARDIAACHHERWDGSGYPGGLAGEEIPLLARICSIADVFDALTSARPYKQPWTVEAALDWIAGESGKHFDPAVVAAFRAAMPEILRIRQLYRDDIIDPNQVLNLPETVRRGEAWVAWEEGLSVGIDVIDEHHRYLFDLTNDLYEVVSNKRGSREVARVMKALDQYVQVHFRAEERMMAHYGYAALDRQETQHHQFEGRLREFYAEMHDNPLCAPFEMLAYLRDWLVRHIVHEDAELRVLVEPRPAGEAIPA